MREAELVGQGAFHKVAPCPVGMGVLAFASEEDVPFTDNQAERDLRLAKVKQKISGCFRTEIGTKVYARLQAVVLTFRKQGLKVFASLRELFLPRPVTVC